MANDATLGSCPLALVDKESGEESHDTRLLLHINQPFLQSIANARRALLGVLGATEIRLESCHGLNVALICDVSPVDDGTVEPVASSQLLYTLAVSSRDIEIEFHQVGHLCEVHTDRLDLLRLMQPDVTNQGCVVDAYLASMPGSTHELAMAVLGRLQFNEIDAVRRLLQLCRNSVNGWAVSREALIEQMKQFSFTSNATFVALDGVLRELDLADGMDASQSYPSASHRPRL